MRLRTLVVSVGLAVVAMPAIACREDADCKKMNQRCVQGQVLRYCGPWNQPDAPTGKTFVPGQFDTNTNPPKRNDKAMGVSCNTDADCRSGQTCTRPSTGSQWRCVAR
jgi:hypothetical protein